MRDGVTISKAGLPVVVFVHTNFELAARSQARIQGTPDLNILAFPANSVGIPEAEEAAKAAAAVQEFPAMIEDPQ